MIGEIAQLLIWKNGNGILWVQIDCAGNFAGFIQSRLCNPRKGVRSAIQPSQSAHLPVELP
jgi:hypothetical protein